MTVPFVGRLGAEGSVDLALQRFVLTPEAYGTVSNLQARINPIRLVACTALAGTYDTHSNTHFVTHPLTLSNTHLLINPLAHLL